MKLFGFLFNWNDFSRQMSGESTEQDSFVARLHKVPQFSDITDNQGVNQTSRLPKTWRLLNFRSNKALAGEELDGRLRLDGDEFVYRIYVRANLETGSVIFASRRLSISEAAVMTQNTYVLPKLQRRNIRVAELSERLLRRDTITDYFVTFLSADVPGYGDSLKSISLEGEDIAGAGFFFFDDVSGSTEKKHGLHYSNFTARRIGLRPVDSRLECGRFGVDNRIEFSDDSIQELEDFLLYVNV